MKISCLTLLALLPVAGTLPAAGCNGDTVFGPGKTTWTHSGAVIPAGETGEGELTWSGTTLKFVPENGECRLENVKFFTFLLRVP